jgi:hypothetical protein
VSRYCTSSLGDFDCAIKNPTPAVAGARFSGRFRAERRTTNAGPIGQAIAGFGSEGVGAAGNDRLLVVLRMVELAAGHG